MVGLRHAKFEIEVYSFPYTFAQRISSISLNYKDRVPKLLGD
jgi:hypothetical protein